MAFMFDRLFLTTERTKVTIDEELREAALELHKGGILMSEFIQTIIRPIDPNAEIF